MDFIVDIAFIALIVFFVVSGAKKVLSERF